MTGGDLCKSAVARSCKDGSLCVSETEQLCCGVVKHCRDRMDRCVVQQLQLGSHQLTLNFK